ncbi:MAG: hypothetical protein EZS28_018005 [Streblomastix strix]|uniref:Uncharacterized protein n=1 Tax=Streblomastix strix TaxID=222440 RepID=A0A5J4VUY3_9EUKA|nr:MAG: hypothetical protein EZS28_018005 [Streblomastix strix]
MAIQPKAQKGKWQFSVEVRSPEEQLQIYADNVSKLQSSDEIPMKTRKRMCANDDDVRQAIIYKKRIAHVKERQKALQFKVLAVFFLSSYTLILSLNYKIYPLMKYSIEVQLSMRFFNTYTPLRSRDLTIDEEKPQQEIQTERPRRHRYTINKYKEVPRETAQIEPEQVVQDTYLSHPNLEIQKFFKDQI